MGCSYRYPLDMHCPRCHSRQSADATTNRNTAEHVFELEIDCARGVTMTVPGSFGRASLLVLVCFGRMVLGLVLESERLLPSFYLLARRNAFDDSPEVVHHKTIEMTRHIKARHQGGNQQRLQMIQSMYVQQTIKLERICRDALNPIPMAIFI